MKQIIRRGAVTLLSFIIFLSCAISQDVALHIQKKGVVALETGVPSGEIYYMNDVNAKVLKRFHKWFGERPGARWFKTEDGFVVIFKGNNMTTNVYFATSGAIQSRVNYYSEQGLPRNVRHTVKSNFYDYSITHVIEVQQNDLVCYLVKIADSVSIKTVRVIGDEWMLVEDLKKG